MTYEEQLALKPLTTEQKTRLDCVMAVSNCAKELYIDSVELLAMKADILKKYVLEGIPVKKD